MVGFPHSEIFGSKPVRGSPKLIAAYYVLHRLCTPRHPLDALKTLNRSHYLCPQHHRSALLLYSGDLRHRVRFASGVSQRRLDRSDQEKTRIHVRTLFLPWVGRVKRDSDVSLYDVERSARGAFAGTRHGQTLLFALSDVLLCMKLRRIISGRLADRSCISSEGWWSQTDSNRRHPACKAGALPTELWPHQFGWWARVDSNYRPHAYQACALTT